MKKSIILGGVLISSLAFAKGGYNNNNMDQVDAVALRRYEQYQEATASHCSL